MKCSVDRTPLSSADQAYYARDYGSAAKLYHQMAYLVPNSAQAQAGLIHILLNQNKIAEALKAANDLARAQPQNPVALTVLGETYLRRGEFDLALPVLARAVKLNPCYGRAYYAESVMEDRMAMNATSKRLLDLAHSLNPRDPDIALAWAWSLPPDQRFTALDSDVVDSYLRGSDLQDLKSWIAESKDVAASHCTVTTPAKGTSLPLQIGPASYGPDQIFLTAIDATIDGRKRRMRLEASSNTITIFLPEAERLGLKLQGPYLSSFTYAGGSARLYLATVPSIRFGDVEYRNCPAQVVDVLYAPEDRAGSDGYVGAGFFADFLVDINMPAQTLALTALPRLTVHQAEGAPFWSVAAQQDRAEVPSVNTMQLAPYNATVPSGMENWTHVVILKATSPVVPNEVLVPTRIGPGHDRLFSLSLSAPHPRIASTAANEPATLENMIPPGSKDKRKQISKLVGSDHYFMEFGGLVVPVASWQSYEFDNFSIRAGLDVGGNISQNAIKQLDIKLDYRDSLVKFSRPTTTK